MKTRHRDAILSAARALVDERGGPAFSVEELAVRADGAVLTWGSNFYGFLGNGTQSPVFSATPTVVPGLGNVVAAVLVWQEYFFLGGIAFILGSVCDTLDGRYSRMSGKGTPFGAFLDSTLDRVEEGIVLTAVAAYFATQGDDLAVAAVVLAVLGSLMVSYTRARAEALGVECKVGIADRAVRVVILSAGLLLTSFGLDVLEPAVYVLAGLSVVTVLQRIFHVRSQLVHGTGAA